MKNRVKLLTWFKIPKEKRSIFEKVSKTVFIVDVTQKNAKCNKLEMRSLIDMNISRIMIPEIIWKIKKLIDDFDGIS